MSKCNLIVIGEMNTDIVVSGLPYFPKSGELVNGNELYIGPGGKSRNIAAMAAALMPAGSVAMVSKTSKDKYGLWREPLDALNKIGVDTRFVTVASGGDASDLPGVALILVDKDGNNQIIGAPGITRKFDPADIDNSEELFKEVAVNKGFMAFIGNCPIATAKHGINQANKLGIKVVFDPGGADDLKALVPLLSLGIYLFKPNEHEAKAMSGIEVKDFSTAKKAAQVFMDLGVKNILITAGASGAYLFSGKAEIHIPIPDIKAGNTKDETGCGDQAMAALCAYLQTGMSIDMAAEIAVLSGTLQFHRSGIKPVTKLELSKYI
jgi:ribokinase